MQKIKNYNIAQLLMQLHFIPRKKRSQQLENVEKLLTIIKPDREYPFEFVVFRITGHRPRNLPECEPLQGSQLIEDLKIFIWKLSGQVAPNVSDQKEKIYSVEELAKFANVSTKTVTRWRKKGLIAKKYIFADNKKRLGVAQSAVDRFLAKNPEIISKAAAFSRLTPQQKKTIIKQAIRLAAKKNMSRYRVIDHIASKLERSHETIRYILLEYEKQHTGKNIFDRPSGVLHPEEAAEIYRLYTHDHSVTQLAKQFTRCRSSIYRVIKRRKAKALLAVKVEFIDSSEFLAEDAFEDILTKPLIELISPEHPHIQPSSLKNSSLTEYLKALKKCPSLNREQEVELFRRYNYLKYLICVKRTTVKVDNISSEILGEIEDYLNQTDALKKFIIESQLRLVVSIANKHAGSGINLQDLISEGNFSLMTAVEKFDYTRGFRFATYASWVIAKNYARKIPAESARFDKAKAGELANVQHNLRTKNTSADIIAVEKARKSLVEVIKDDLDEREQYIIINHFGLTGSLIRKNRKTLQQIGDDLELTKERIRQIELSALQKLKQMLSIEEFELLMK